MKTALILIYNHNFEKNIEVLESIYNNRFSLIFHLMPFYTGNKSNVIAVYGNSLTFQEYVNQAYSYLQSINVDHFLFVADDMLINPAINETNYNNYFGVTKKDCFIPRLGSIPENKNYWHNYRNAIWLNFRKFNIEFPIKQVDLNKIQNRFKKLGIKNSKLSLKNIYRKRTIGFLLYDILRSKFKFSKLVRTKYPLVRSYSDIFLINKDSLRSFSHFCGIFGAFDLFVEIAIPSSIVYTTSNIITEKDLSYKGMAFWDAKRLNSFKSNYKNISDLIENYPSDTLYIHPIKLSKF